MIAVADQAFSRALAGERVVRDVIVRHRITGEERIVRSAAAPVKIEGRVIAAVAVNTDVTERRHAEANLRLLNETLEARVDEAVAERRLWASIFETSDALINAIDGDYRFLAFNRAYAEAFQRHTGHRPVIGASLLDFLTDEQRSAKRGRAGPVRFQARISQSSSGWPCQSMMIAITNFVSTPCATSMAG